MVNDKRLAARTDKVQICMFVYNLGTTLAESVQSVISACGDLNYELFIMCNGCEDASFNIAQKISKQNTAIKAINLTYGDKSETWNRFVYDYYDGSALPVFIDGDLTFANLAIYNIVEFHHEHPHYNSISGFPWGGGRHSTQWQERLLRDHEFTGNLYLLNTDFLHRLIAQKVKLPKGLIGDDSMLGFLTATNLCDGTDKPLERRGVCQSAVFQYERLNPLSYGDMKLYFRRRVRYATRAMQQNAIVPVLKRQGLSAMPEYANDIFRTELPGLRWKGLDTLFDYLARKKIRHELDENS
ncbi:MAG: glycosyltransferase family 2 protein [Alteromonadaceae bacterium]|nr:glycosyltransferase family 2 protein [Alteromonadaceae bacterium]